MHMSDLQIGLLFIGVVVIAGVIAYNRMQEVRFRRRAEASFGKVTGDALLESPAPMPGADRIEPLLSPGNAESERVVLGRVEPVGISVNNSADIEPSPIDYIIQVNATQVVGRDDLQRLLEALEGLGKRVQVLASAAPGAWAPVASAPPGVTRVRVALQLADRRGHVTQDDLFAFQSLVAQWAENIGASVDAPDLNPYAQVASDLDQFCADVDVVVGLNVVAATGEPFSGFKVRNCAEAVGFRMDDSAFRYADPHGITLFSLENMQSGPLDPDRIKTSTINGVTLLLDVPRLGDGLAAFDQMVHTGKQLADQLGGTLVDDNRTAVTEAGLEQIRNQLRRIYGEMQARGIEAGSRTALRLFS
jgi:ZipA-like protein with FtsZ-binding domain